MFDIKKLKYKLIAYGIIWIWVIAILNQYIDIDGWILYPICATGVFLLIVLSLSLFYDVSRVHRCRKCGKYYHETQKKMHSFRICGNPFFDYEWECDDCLKDERKGG